jgi:mannose-6-phosphate isomerase-like protein (cupin superfamily)
MAGYTLVNLKEVEDQAPKFGFAPNLESRFARGALGLEKSGLTYFRLAPGFRMPFGHTHSEQEEIYVVVSGSGRIKLDDEVLDLGQWDALRIAPGTWRNVEAGPAGAELLAFGAPRTDEPDIEMTQSWWTD